MDGGAVKGRVVVVGAGDIGRAVARRLACDGFDVALGYRSTPPATSALLQGLEPGRAAAVSGRIAAFQVDACDPGSCRGFFRQVVTTGRFRGLVNAFGTVAEGPLVRTAASEINDMLEVHVTAILNVIQAGAFGLLKSGNGAIVNVGSVASRHAVAGTGAYGAAKGAVESVGRSLALELAAYGVTCNTVQPGFVDAGSTASKSDAWKSAVTRHIPSGRLVTPDEVAALVAFLQSADARSITGQQFVVDGGLSTGSVALLRDLKALVEA